MTVAGGPLYRLGELLRDCQLVFRRAHGISAPWQALATVGLPRRPTPALFAIGAAALVLLFVGIHNAWDTVTYMALEKRAPKAR